MKALDYVILVVYFIMLNAVAVWVRKNQDSKDHLTGGRKSPWYLIALSVLATQISTVTFIGGPGWSYTEGIQVLILYISMPLCMSVCSIIFIPFFYNLKIHSVYEYIEMRFSKNTSVVVVIFYLINMAVTLGALILAPAIIINSVIGINIILCIFLIIIIASIYTMVGGIKGVMTIDFIQMLLFWFGMFFIFYLVISNMPESFSEILQTAKASNKLNLYDFNMSFSAPNTVFAGFIGFVLYNIAYYGCEQTQLQRMLTSRSIKDLRIGLSFTGIAVIIQMSIFMILGIVFFVYYDGASFASPNDIFITYIKTNIPSGVLGLLISVLFAGSMSSIDSILNSMSVVTVKHIVPLFIKKPTDKTDTISYRLSIIIWGLISLAFTMLYYHTMGKFSLLEAIAAYGSYILGSLFGVFILALFFKNANAKGTIIGTIVSLAALGLISNIYPIFWVWNVPVGALICVIVGYIVSILTKKDIDKEGEKYTIFEVVKTHIKNNDAIKEGGVYSIPFKATKWEIVPLFIMVGYCIFLYFLFKG